MLLDALERAAEALAMRDAPLVVAVSGGVDSIVLLHALEELRIGTPLVVAHVDHGLRGEASAADARFVAAVSAELGLACEIEKVAPLALRSGPSRSAHMKALPARQ